MKQKLLFYCLSLFVINKNICQPPLGRVLWLRADNNVTVDANNKVSRWKDISPNSSDVIQLNPLYQPTLVKNIFGNKPGIFFDGVNGKYFLSNSSANLMEAGSPRTVFIVGLLDSMATDNGGGDFPSAGGTMFTFRRTAPVFAIQAARINHSVAPKADYIYTAGLGTNSNAIAADRSYFNRSKKCEFIDVFISSGANSYLKVRQDGHPVTVEQTNPIVSEHGTTGFTVGDREDFGGQDWQGYIAEIIVYNRELNSDEIAHTESYLSHKYHYCFTPPEVSSASKAENVTWQDLKLYPNPVNNILAIEGLPQTGKVRLTIIDVAGIVRTAAEINNSGSYKWDISRITKGNYILKIESNGNVVTKKFAKL